ncbi:hypothetical protein I6E47_08920 [Prevotella dentalis]|jgi:RHS repeat-associated protein|nr:hypothetical protein [Prevotella dentalis]
MRRLIVIMLLGLMTTLSLPASAIAGSRENDHATQPYKYIGKELDRTHGARHYDPVTGRWNVMDALAEKYNAWSPYVSCGDDPVNAVGPDGKDYWSTSDPLIIIEFFNNVESNRAFFFKPFSTLTYFFNSLHPYTYTINSIAYTIDSDGRIGRPAHILGIVDNPGFRKGTVRGKVRMGKIKGKRQETTSDRMNKSEALRRNIS